MPTFEVGIRHKLSTTLHVRCNTLIFVAALLLWPRSALVAQDSRADIEVLQVRPNFYMLVGAGGNVGVQIGTDGVVVVDSGLVTNAAALVNTIKKITPQPIRYIINTSADVDHVGGNEIVAKAGQTLLNSGGGAVNPDFTAGGAAILSSEQVLAKMTEASAKSAFPFDALPTETFNQPRRYMYLNGEGIEIFHEPAAHTNGDSIVFFRRSDVIVAGDILDTTRFPTIDVANGGSIQGEIAALQKLVNTAIPSVPLQNREEGTLIIPGHGRICNQLDVVEYRDMVAIIRDRVDELVKQGLSLDQVKAAAPARGYIRRYGSDSGPWTTNDFVEAVYRTITQKAQ